MKKKFGLWLNIVTICLCVCAIAIGVYAASSASLTASGTIGFTAHGCKVKVTGYIYGHAQGTTPEQMADGYPTLSPEEGGTPVYLTANNEPKLVSSNNDELEIGTRYFSDMNSLTGKPDDIYIVLQVENASEYYKVQATIDTTTLTFGKVKVSVIGDTTAILDKTGSVAKAEFTFKLELLPEEDGSYAAIAKDALQDVEINMSFAKYEGVPNEYKDKQGLIYTLSDDGTSWSVRGDCYPNDNGTFVNNVKEHNIVIADMLYDIPVKEIEVDAFSKQVAISRKCSLNIKSVVIPNTIETIGNYAFAYCYGLTSVTIEGNVSTIGSNSFYNCYNLMEVINKSSLTIVASDNGNGYVAKYAKQVISVPNNNLTTDKDGFIVYNDVANNSKILVGYQGTQSELIFPSEVTHINQYSFYERNDIISVVIGDNVTKIGARAFQNCNRLISVTLGSNVTTIDSGAFGQAGIGIPANNIVEVINKSSLTIEAGKTTNGYIAHQTKQVIQNESASNLVKDENGYIIYNDEANNSKILVAYAGTQTNLTLPSEIIEIHKGVFYDRIDITQVTISDHVTKIGRDAFYNCINLTRVNISNIEVWCGIEFAFSGSLVSASTYSNPLVNGSSLYINNEKVTSVIIPNSIKEIKSYAFCSYTYLTQITIHDTVTSIGSSAFSGCTGLTSVTIPDSVTSIDSSAFSGCDGLTQVNISSLEAWCNIDFASSNANPLYYGKNLYLNGVKITDLEIPSSIKEIKPYAFYNCTGLTSVTIPDSVTSIGSYAFYGCDGLTSVIFKGTNPPTFETDVFDDCNANLKIYVPVGCGDAYSSKVTPSGVSEKVEEKTIS